MTIRLKVTPTMKTEFWFIISQSLLKVTSSAGLTTSADPQRLTMQLEMANSNTALDFDVSIYIKN